MSVRPIGHEDRLTLVEHLDELRTRIIVCLAALVVAFAITYWQNDAILDFVNAPLRSAQKVKCTGDTDVKDPLERSACFDSNVAKAAAALADVVVTQSRLNDRIAASGDVPEEVRVQAALAARASAAAEKALRVAAASSPKSNERQPVTLGVTEPFVTTLTVAGYAALLLALPLILYQLYAFILPAFSPVERRMAVPFMLAVPFLFIAGVAFGYLLALPRAVDFLQNFNNDAFDILIQAKDYYRFSILLLAIMGLLFQVPVGVLAIVRLGVVTVKQLRAARGYVILGIAVVAAVATPTPDPFTMLVVMAPLILLWEGSLLIARFFPARERSDRWAGWLDGDEDEEDEDEGYEVPVAEASPSERFEEGDADGLSVDGQDDGPHPPGPGSTP